MPDKEKKQHKCNPAVIAKKIQTEEMLKEAAMKDQSLIPAAGMPEVMVRDIAPTMTGSLADADKRYKELQSFIKDQMVEGEDYGRIPGCPKPSLFKPGAEKLLEIYGYAVSEILVPNRIEDWEKGFFHYEMKAIATSKRSGQIIGTGIGSCNTREKKFVTQDPYSLVNTIEKMAKKRAVVDLALLVTRSSGIFTQDVEDLEGVVEPQQKSQSALPAQPTDDQKKKQLDIAAWCLEMSDMDKEKAKNMLVTLTTFMGKDKKEVPGVDNANRLFGKRLDVSHDIVGKEYKNWKATVG